MFIVLLLALPHFVLDLVTCSALICLLHSLGMDVCTYIRTLLRTYICMYICMGEWLSG